MDAIKVENLTKRFEDVTAVDQITFAVEQGELFGLLGPNGAGKTTTINMLSTLLKPTSGRAEVAGFDVGQEPGQRPEEHRGRLPGAGPGRQADRAGRTSSSTP